MSDFKLGSGNKPKSQSLGSVMVQVDAYDVKANSATGTNIQTGESLTIRMANAAEYERYFLKPDGKSTEERQSAAALKIKRQPSSKDRTSNAPVGSVVNFERVRDTNAGLIAAWSEAVSTKPENDVVAVGKVQITSAERQAQDGTKFPVRIAQVVIPETATEITREALEKAFSAEVSGKAARSGALIAISDGTDTQAHGLTAAYDKDTKSFLSGVDVAIGQPLQNEYMAKAATVIAASLETSFDDLQFSTKVDAGYMRGLYDAVRSGDVQVGMARTLSADLMPHIRDAVMEGEGEDSRKPQLSNRGFFEAGITFHKSDDRPEMEPASVKHVVPTGFLPHPTSSDFVRETRQSLGDDILDAVASQRPSADQTSAKDAEGPAPKQDEVNFDAPAFS